ncbi:hypothetical protein [Tepidimonas sp. HKU79]|uniref:hypothetical protein n=1 Tax=Tepidimonas sp. HKU79 TaxID=3414505 RepID=UPI003C7EA7A3
MSYTTFRDAYLTEAENRLASVNVSTASTNDLLIAGALYKMAAAVAEADLLGPSALRLLETMTGSQLEAWLQSATNREAFERILSSPEAMRAVAANSQAMAAVLANSNAWAAVVANSQAMAAVAANSQAMAAVLANSNAWAAVVASSQAMAAVAASQTALAAIRQSSAAISAINASPQALDILYNAATKFTHAGGAWSANPATLVTGNFLLVRIRQTANQAGWSDGYSSGQYIRIGGSSWTATNGQSTNSLISRTTLPHVYDNALRPVNNTTIQYYLYNSHEIAYLAA